MAHDNLPPRFSIGPLHAILLCFPVALYPSALLSDIAYLNTQVIQWTNFAQWLIAGADVFAGLVVAWATFSFFRGRDRQRLRYLVAVMTMFVAGVINAFQHSKDGWHSVGTVGIVLSIACTVLALLAALIAYGRPFMARQGA